MSAVVLHAPFAGWLGPLDEVPDPVFAERMMGDGVAIDPVEGVLCAPADAVVVSVPTTAHAVTLRLENGVELLIHVGLETVALGGEGFRALVTAGERVRTGDPLIEFDLDRVAAAASDLITPIVAASEGARVVADRLGRRVAAGERIATVSGTVAQVAAEAGPEQRRALLVEAPHGIHARPAARIVALLKPYAATVTFRHGERTANGASTVALLTLGARNGETIEAVASGADAGAALDALAAFARERFGDPLTVAPAARPVASGGGVTAAPGLAVGQVLQWRAADRVIPADAADPVAERAALGSALASVEARQGGSGVSGAIAEAHRALLADPVLRERALAEIAAGRSAAQGWRTSLREAADALLATGDPLLAERVGDLRDLERQVIAALLGDDNASAPPLPPDTILVAEDLLPSQFQALPRDRLVGICLAAGGPTAHVALLAAAAGVPMLVAAGRGVLDLPDGQTVVLDADAARLEADPDVERLAAVAEQLATRRARRAASVRDALAPCRTADGARIEVFANLGSADETGEAVALGAEGCGLLRTEFLFLGRAAAPDEEEQRALYARIATALGERPLIVRTLDIGGDKPVPYLPQAAEENPALGLRGIRLGLARPDMLGVQLRAILRGVPGAQCRIMLPMIVDREEVRAVRRLLDAAMVETGRTEPVELGVMIETPAAAMLADSIASEADFLSIGTNDLTQYALAADRGNAGVSAMVDAFHPAVLRLIAQAVSGAERHGRWTGVCGGLASDPRAAALLVGLGVTELSVVPAAVPTVKAAVRAIDMAAARALATRACACGSAAEVRALLEERA